MVLYDYRQLKWDVDGDATVSTGGTMLKTYDMRSGVYYKASAYDFRLQKEVGYETFFEVFASRLGHYMGIPVLNYGIVKAYTCVDSHETQLYLAMSRDFKMPGDRKMSLEDYYTLYSERKESISMFIKRLGFKKYIDQMIVFDYLIYNRDRTGDNIEIIDNHGKLRLAPFFDNGNSFFSILGKEDKYIKDYDITIDNPVNNYIGSLHLQQNLDMLDEPVVVNRLSDYIVNQLLIDFHNEMSEVAIDRIRHQVLYRYEYLLKHNKIKPV